MEYKAIDLGLPSGRLWADKNVGAEKETDYGLYFQWGDTIGYTDASHSTWATCPGNGSNSDYNGISIEAWDAENLQSVNGIEDSTLKIEADAATVNMGSKWRMPTIEDCAELYSYTNYEYAVIDEVEGCKFISKADPSKYIFLPFAGALPRILLRVRGQKASFGVVQSSQKPQRVHTACSSLSLALAKTWAVVTTLCRCGVFVKAIRILWNIKQ